MFDYMIGKIQLIGEDHLILEVNNVGYYVTATSWTLSQLQEGESTKLYTKMVVREDDISLFGFAKKDERILYDLLTTVKGVGPRVAIHALSGMSIPQFYNAILSEDVLVLQKAPGIGKKTAERIILELKDKIGKQPFTEAINISSLETVKVATNKEAMDALISLGYTYNEALKALEQIPKDWDLSKQIRESLKLLSS